MEENLETRLKASFVSTANQLTQLYTHSLNFQKQNYCSGFYAGYSKSLQDTTNWISKNSTDKVIPIELVIEYLKSQLEQVEEEIPVNSSNIQNKVPDNNLFGTPQASMEKNFSSSVQGSRIFQNNAGLETSTNTSDTFSFGSMSSSLESQPTLTNNYFGGNANIPVVGEQKKRHLQPMEAQTMDFTYSDHVKKSKINVNS